MIFSRIFLLSWFVFYKKQKNNVSTEFEIVNKKSIICKNKTDGHDNHVYENEADNLFILSKIKKNKERYTQLQLLQNPHISIIEKLIIIEAIEKEEIDSIYTFNLQKGGFWKDWE